MRRSWAFLTALAIAAASCGATARPAPIARPPLPAPTVDARLGALLASAGVEGTFLLYDPALGQILVHDPARADRNFLPASTFKILNSLIALETGAVRDADELFRWDGVDRGSSGWNSDQTLRQAIYRST